MEDSAAEVEWLIKHRLGREQKVIDGLHKLRRATVDDLVTVVYDDVDTSLHNMAKLSLSAHLIKLRRENRAVQHEADETWEMVEL